MTAIMDNEDGAVIAPALRRSAARFVPGGNSNAVNELRDLAVAAADEIERLRLERELWRKLAEARSGILVAYRVGGRPPGKHIDAARDAERRLSELEAGDR